MGFCNSLKSKMKAISAILLFITIFLAKNVFTQTIDHKLFFKSGIGPVYSFFEIAKPPFQYLNLNEFTISKTFGRTIDMEVGYQMKKQLSISLIFTDHAFSNNFNVFDTLRNTNIEFALIGKLYRHQYYIQAQINKVFKQNKKYSLGAGTGLLFVNDGQQYFGAYSGIPNVNNPAVTLHEYRNWEFGTPLAIFFERKLKPNINLGLKAQAYIIISVGSFESISLNPYFSVRF